MDYAANAVYNLSWIVQESVKIQKPIVAVSLDCTYQVSIILTLYANCDTRPTIRMGFPRWR